VRSLILIVALMVFGVVSLAQAEEAPTLSASGGPGLKATLKWTAVKGATEYRAELCEVSPLKTACEPSELFSLAAGTETTQRVSGESEVRYRVQEFKPKEGAWSNAVTVHYTPTADPMGVGVDAGGWDWESALSDVSGAVKLVRSSYTHYNSESQMALLAKYGLRLLPLFYEGGSMSELDTAAHVETIVNWCKAYCSGGTYWAGKTPDLGATTIELVNEPGNPYLHSGEPQSEASKLAYVDLTKKVHAALAALTPAPALLVSYDGGYEGDQYGEWIFAHGAEADGVTVHPYGGHVERSKSAQGNRERVTRAHEKSGKPVYVTEVGWPTCGETGDSLNWSQAEQAENISHFAEWASGLGYVALDVNFNYADYEHDCYGIVEAAGSPHKPSYAALKEAAERW
jgi:hypothetical protein